MGRTARSTANRPERTFQLPPFTVALFGFSVLFIFSGGLQRTFVCLLPYPPLNTSRTQTNQAAEPTYNAQFHFSGAQVRATWGRFGRPSHPHQPPTSNHQPPPTNHPIPLTPSTRLPHVPRAPYPPPTRPPSASPGRRGHGAALPRGPGRRLRGLGAGHAVAALGRGASDRCAIRGAGWAVAVGGRGAGGVGVGGWGGGGRHPIG